MTYGLSSTRQLTLPSGATCRVRRLAQSDFIALGDFPMVSSGGESRIGEVKVSPEAIRFGIAINKIILTRCTGRLRSGTETLKIVDRPFDECPPGEIAIELLDQPDADAILSAVRELSGMTGEAGRKVQSFPDQDRAGGNDSPPVETVRGSPDGNPQTKS